MQDNSHSISLKRKLNLNIYKWIHSAIRRNPLFSWLILVFIVSEALVNPTGNFPLIDDWCYAGGIFVLEEKGYIDIGDYPAMTLVTQILWGLLFKKLFSFSFFVMRLSSIVSAVIGLYFLNKLLLDISKSKEVAVLGCLVIMFNPMVFCLTNTFMTDVNFNTLVILCCYFIYHYFQSGKISDFIFFFIFSLILVFLRQYGIVVPVCFFLAACFHQQHRVRSLFLGLIGFAVIYYLLKSYEDYLRDLGTDTYKFSGDVHLTDQSFWDNLFVSFNDRYKEMIRQMLFYTMPLAIVFLPWMVKNSDKKILLFSASGTGAVCWFLFNHEVLTSANIFYSMTVGPETFYESFNGARHNSYPAFDHFMFYLRLISVFITVLVLFTGSVFAFRKWRGLFTPEIVFLIAFLFSYGFMVFITESYFDRYHIPLITVTVILMVFFTRNYQINYKYAIIPLLFWAWVSVAGTKDYLEWNRQKRKAYKYLHHDLKIPTEKINAGLEINCWNEGYNPGWRDFIYLKDYEYLIQFNSAEGFKLMKEFEFRRYFPFTKDKICIFKRMEAGPRPE